jgi:hypothetical protein
MDVHFNPRENGACPFCSKRAGCLVRQKLAGAVSAMKDLQKQGLEIVIYSCPRFVET